MTDICIPWAFTARTQYTALEESQVESDIFVIRKAIDKHDMRVASHNMGWNNITRFSNPMLYKIKWLIFLRKTKEKIRALLQQHPADGRKILDEELSNVCGSYYLHM